MRHLWSLLAGIVAAPLAWLGLATGQYHTERLVGQWETDQRFDTADLIGPALFLIAVGVLLGLLGTLRWSPAGPLAAGVLLAAPTVFMFINPFETLDAFSYPELNRLLNQDLELWRPVANGTLLVLGALLLMAVFSRQRWRAWPQQPAPARPASDEEVVAGIAALTDSPEPEPATGEGEGEAAAADQAAAPGDEPATTPEPVTEPEPEPEPEPKSARPAGSKQAKNETERERSESGSGTSSG